MLSPLVVSWQGLLLQTLISVSLVSCCILFLAPSSTLLVYPLDLNLERTSFYLVWYLDESLMIILPIEYRVRPLSVLGIKAFG
ncbi:hypothetical protein FKM82_023618 [Ascaphus truei]